MCLRNLKPTCNKKPQTHSFKLLCSVFGQSSKGRYVFWVRALLGRVCLFSCFLVRLLSVLVCLFVCLDRFFGGFELCSLSCYSALRLLRFSDPFFVFCGLGSFVFDRAAHKEHSVFFPRRPCLPAYWGWCEAFCKKGCECPDRGDWLNELPPTRELLSCHGTPPMHPVVKFKVDCPLRP